MQNQAGGDGPFGEFSRQTATGWAQEGSATTLIFSQNIDTLNTVENVGGFTDGYHSLISRGGTTNTVFRSAVSLILCFRIRWGGGG